MTSDTLLDGLRIWIVEDEILFFQLLKRIIERGGGVVQRHSASLAEALKNAHHEDCDFALLDVQLGREHVFPVLEVLERRGLPFALVTGLPRSMIPEDCLAYPLILKPFGRDDFFFKIAQALQSYKMLDKAPSLLAAYKDRINEEDS
ncbi:MAG: response regulator [Myxococcales bacterium]|nr:response regulator [Myxococcales bacterium]